MFVCILVQTKNKIFNWKAIGFVTISCFEFWCVWDFIFIFFYCICYCYNVNNLRLKKYLKFDQQIASYQQVRLTKLYIYIHCRFILSSFSLTPFHYTRNSLNLRVQLRPKSNRLLSSTFCWHFKFEFPVLFSIVTAKRKKKTVFLENKINSTRTRAKNRIKVCVKKK